MHDLLDRPRSHILTIAWDRFPAGPHVIQAGVRVEEGSCSGRIRTDPRYSAWVDLTSPGQRAFWIAAAASAALCAPASDLKKSAGTVTPVAWFGQ